LTHDELVALARSTAQSHHLFEHIICGICEQESSWVPWAYRYEPAFYSRYVEPLFNDGKITITEAHGRAISWGLGQTMGQSVREIGYADWLPMLCDPAIGLEWVCRLFERKLQHAQGSIVQALQLWNGGGNLAYAPSVLAKSAKYQ
jgi:hypothetical protein